MEKEPNFEQSELIDGNWEKVFELENEIEMRKLFIQQNQDKSEKSAYYKNLIEKFNEEIKKLTIELLNLRIKIRDKESGK